MALFPFFINIKDAVGFITGGGTHALEKIRRLEPYGPKLCVFSKEYLPEIEANDKLELVCRELLEEDLDKNPTFVIVAGENKEENHTIADWCRKRKILVNVVDDQEYCDFIFPSLIAHGNLSIGICTNGASPATGVLLKRKVEEQVPDHIEEILDFLQEKRPVIAKNLKDKKQRFAFYYKLSEICIANERKLTEEEFAGLLENEC